MCGTMLSHALHASFADPADQRVSDRRVLRLEARVASPAGAGGVEVHNLSRTGMLLECTAGAAAGSAIEVELPGGSLHCAEVVWTDEGLFGCRFDKPLTRAQLSAALLRSEVGARRRRRHGPCRPTKRWPGSTIIGAARWTRRCSAGASSRSVCGCGRSPRSAWQAGRSRPRRRGSSSRVNPAPR